MMLENLFARAGQEQAFLCLTACGLVMGALTHAGSLVRRRRRGLGAALDVLTAAALLMTLLLVLFRFGGGMRAYGILGVMIGVLLYHAGVRCLVEAGFSLVQKLRSR